ncbi:meiotic recombination [Dispira parvispora]|uniref:Double-strand break repair protein n=1 Tax=Dispira parvispora TaxID=1520584 RepID=A0A9W8E0W0_9FUNG|nr:meiotic recombination [Dispira parvispora]
MPQSDNVLRLLLATDNHLGYLEKDPVRGDDSFLAFEEILQIAQTEEVDGILLGGDLFHDNRPSRKTLYRTLKLLRQYCLGDRPCAVQFQSDPLQTLENSFGAVNYEDPNLNVGIPVFTIHGNHDDPTGDGGLSAIDLLSTAGLVNYFGKNEQVDRISVPPLLLRKGCTMLALYGLGNIRDERLHRTFLAGQVAFTDPPEPQDEWFQLFVLHQNRIAHGPTNYIPEEFLDSRFHLVMWGHEHECRIEPERNPTRGFSITQPGSSVATALCEGEAKPKHVAILEIHRQAFKLRKIRLKHVRPFAMQTLALNEIPDLRPFDEQGTMRALARVVDDMLESVVTTWLADLGLGMTIHDLPEALQQLSLPLVRLRVDYSGGYHAINPQRFGNQFVDRVANPKDILYYHRQRKSAASIRNNILLNPAQLALNPNSVEGLGIEDLVEEFLDGKDLQVFLDQELNEAVRLFVDKEESSAITSMVGSYIKDTQTQLNRRGTVVDDQQLRHELLCLRQHRSSKNGPMSEDTSEPSFLTETRDAPQGSNDSQGVQVKRELDFESNAQGQFATLDVTEEPPRTRSRNTSTRAKTRKTTETQRNRITRTNPVFPVVNCDNDLKGHSTDSAIVTLSSDDNDGNSNQMTGISDRIESPPPPPPSLRSSAPATRRTTRSQRSQLGTSSRNSSTTQRKTSQPARQARPKRASRQATLEFSSDNGLAAVEPQTISSQSTTQDTAQTTIVEPRTTRNSSRTSSKTHLGSSTQLPELPTVSDDDEPDNFAEFSRLLRNRGRGTNNG